MTGQLLRSSHAGYFLARQSWRTATGNTLRKRLHQLCQEEQGVLGECAH